MCDRRRLRLGDQYCRATAAAHYTTIAHSSFQHSDCGWMWYLVWNITGNESDAYGSDTGHTKRVRRLFANI